jgi:hypothetical protein
MHRGGQRVEVLLVVAIGHGDQPAAEAGDMVVERRIGAGRGDDGIAGLGDEPDQDAQKLVDPGTHDDALDRPAAVRLRQPLAQHEGLGIAVPADPGELARDRRGDAGRDAEQAFVGAEPQLEPASGPPLDRLGADERDGGGKAGDDRGAGRSHGQDLFKKRKRGK